MSGPYVYGPTQITINAKKDLDPWTIDPWQIWLDNLKKENEFKEKFIKYQLKVNEDLN